MTNTDESVQTTQTLLTDSECEDLYIRCGTPPHVIRHCKAVSRCGYMIARALLTAGVDIDPELVRVSALAHDLFRVRENHGEAAAKLLRSLGHAREAEVVRDHMHYEFNDFDRLNETDIMCLADRLVKEDRYVGLDERIEYLIAKEPDNTERTERILKSKRKTRDFIDKVETRTGRRLDELFGRHCYSLTQRLESLLPLVEKPARYTGGEFNAAEKDPKGRLRFAFAFPDLYEIGMSYLGLQILYHIVNAREGLYLERVFEPAPDMAALMRKEELPLFTLESRTPVRDMDVFGFTLQYEMSYPTVLDMLDLAGITLRSDRRSEEEPLIIAGGPCAFNPEPLADYIDVFLLGDGEELLPAFLDSYHRARQQGLCKQEFLLAACGTRGVYVPAFYDVSYRADGTVGSCRPNRKGVPERVGKALIGDLDAVDFPVRQIVPYIEVVHDRAVTEIFRGCTRGCRFCQAGMLYRPVRERSPESIMRLAEEEIKATGHEELSLLSLSTSDHSRFEDLATSLTADCAAMKVALSLPSLRLDSFSFKVLNEIQKYRRSGLTFAPEAGTQRLRDVINKGISDEDIYSAVEQAIRLGWDHIKLYFMIGLPTETDEDLDGIAEIAAKTVDINRRCGRGGRFRVTVSVSNFVPKPFTPFQWCPQDSIRELRRKHDYLKSKLRIKNVSFSYHDDRTSAAEALLARGDRRLGRVLYLAWKKGAVLDSWAEHFDMEHWSQAMRKCGLDPDFYVTRKRRPDEIFPWEVIDAGITRDYLASEYGRAMRAETTRDCRYGCTGCGLKRWTECPLGGIYE